MTETPPEPPAEGSEQARIARLETEQASMSGKIDRILGIVGGGASPPAGTDEPAGKSASIAEEIRAQLDKRDADEKTKAEKNAQGKTIADLQAMMKELAEKPPEEPVKRRHKIMGWT